MSRGVTDFSIVINRFFFSSVCTVQPLLAGLPLSRSLQFQKCSRSDFFFFFSPQSMHMLHGHLCMLPAATHSDLTDLPYPYPVSFQETRVPGLTLADKEGQIELNSVLAKDFYFLC